MKILELSDLHFEFIPTLFKSFINSLDPTDIDVLILAGDICMQTQIVEALGHFCRRFKYSDVIWVHGNHEYYGSYKDIIWNLSTQACKQNKNLHWLNGDAITIKGQRFLGHTMWFPDAEGNRDDEFFMNDFRVIKEFKEWVYQENDRAITFFNNEMQPDDIIVTHHLPTVASISPRFTDSDLNKFFVCDMTNTINSKRPKAWFHGHTHDSFDYVIQHQAYASSTRVLCNPRGYDHDLNPSFNHNKVIEVY
jgi:Icc-related predicted phosphoesterase